MGLDGPLVGQCVCVPVCEAQVYTLRMNTLPTVFYYWGEL